MNSESLRDRLLELEAAHEQTAAAVTAAERAHAAAIKHAVETGDTDTAEQTETILRAAGREHQRTVAMIEQGRTSLAAAVQREREEAQAIARVAIEAELAEMAQAAAEIDSTFPTLVRRILDLRSQELALRLKARAHFGDVPGGPEFLNALRSIASFLNATASGLQPSSPSSVARAAALGSHAIRRTLHGG